MTSSAAMIGLPFYAAAAFLFFGMVATDAAAAEPVRKPVVTYQPSVPGIATKLPLPQAGPTVSPVLRLKPVEPETVFDRCKRLPRTLPDSARPQVCSVVR